MMDLERNLIDNILECEIKLGSANTAMTFYYPITSLLELLSCDETTMDSAIALFRKQEADRLGDVVIEELKNEKGRYAVTIRKEGMTWVQKNFQPGEFMKRFVSEIKRKGSTVEDIVALFHSLSDEVKVEKVSDNEWAICFMDESLDPYVYHVEQNIFGLEYHRFTKAAYELLEKVK